MKASKDNIRESFSGAAGTYDLHSDLQKDVAGWLADRVKAKICQPLQARMADIGRHDMSAASVTKKAGTPDLLKAGTPDALKVLDIGCGTGNMAFLLKDILTGASVYATDLALPMLEKTRERLGAKSILTASDCEALPFIASFFDIAVSSLAYQWAQDSGLAFREAGRILRPGGLLFFATLGPATLGELRSCYNEASTDGRYPGPEVYPCTETITSLIREAGLEIDSMERHIVKRRYASIYGLIRTLKMIGAAPVHKHKTQDGRTGITLRRAGRIYNERFQSQGGGILATYEVILVSAKKP